MKVRAYWKNENPFDDIDRLSYSKTVEVPDGTDMGVLTELAIKDTKDGFRFDKIEEVKD